MELSLLKIGQNHPCVEKSTDQLLACTRPSFLQMGLTIRISDSGRGTVTDADQGRRCSVFPCAKVESCFEENAGRSVVQWVLQATDILQAGILINWSYQF